MSAFLFGQRAAAHIDDVTPRISAATNRALLDAGETPPKPSARDKLVTTFAGLFPAEIITAHAAMITLTTQTNEKVSPPVTTISDKDTLKAAFYCLAALSIVLYVAGRINAGGKFKPLKDIPLALVPAGGFIAWAAAQRTTAFDAVSDASEPKRMLIAIVVGFVALAISLAVAGKKEKPEGGG